MHQSTQDIADHLQGTFTDEQISAALSLFAQDASLRNFCYENGYLVISPA